jgi:hypothetical protein
MDHHDSFLPEEGGHALSVWVSFKLLAPSEGPGGHEVFHHDTCLCLTGYAWFGHASSRSLSK